MFRNGDVWNKQYRTDRLQRNPAGLRRRSLRDGHDNLKLYPGSHHDAGYRYYQRRPAGSGI